MKTNFVIYCLAGLGLNSVIFERLDLSLAKEVHYLEWLPPEPKEPLAAYVERIMQGIAPTSDPLVLIGHSFGGVVMQEISKHLSVKHLIIISSIKSKKEKGLEMNVLMPVLPIHKLVTKKLILNSFKYWGKFRGYVTPEAQAVFLQAAAQHSTYYYHWSTSTIFAWESENVTTPISHLHGTKDKTFPFRRILSPVIAVEGGTHFMVYNKAPIISKLIRKILLE